MNAAIRNKDIAALQKRYIPGICFYTYNRCCMYMVYLIENHGLKNENQGQKKQQAFFFKKP